MEEIKRGDVVRLKSKGPLMTTATETDRDGEVRCVWFDDEQHDQSKMFHVDMLTKTAPEPVK